MGVCDPILWRLHHKLQHQLFSADGLLQAPLVIKTGNNNDQDDKKIWTDWRFYTKRNERRLPIHLRSCNELVLLELDKKYIYSRR